MKTGTTEDERPGSTEHERRQLWNWKPSSGEGSAAALSTLKRAERVKSRWRRLGQGVLKRGDDGTPSAE